MREKHKRHLAVVLLIIFMGTPWLISLPDGLLVANCVSPELNPDTLAAFLPQIFGRVSQCTKELRMGDLNNLNFTVGNLPWKIFRVNAVFFAAFGKAGEPLPTAQLAALAAELADYKPALVVLDVFELMHSKDSDKRGELKPILYRLDRLRESRFEKALQRPGHGAPHGDSVGSMAPVDHLLDAWEPLGIAKCGRLSAGPDL